VRELITRATTALVDTSTGLRLIGAAVVAVLLIGPSAALAQQPASRTEEVSASFTIEAIDHASRVVTLRNKAGLLEEVYCGPEVQRFDQLKVGDVVTFRYYETLVTALSRPGAPSTTAASSSTVTRDPGAPGGSIARQTTATVTLEAIDPKTPSVTVRTASGGRSTFRVQNAKNLEGYNVGDQVSVTYTRGLAVSVTPPAQPAAAAPQARMEVYGFAMLDMGFNFKSIDPNWFDTMRINRLPSFDGQFGDDGSTFAGVRQTRLGVRGFNPTPLGELRTTFEFEMFGVGVDEGQTTFRLRHAYGELGAFGAGQYWSPFMDIDVFPNSLEYWGPTGMVFFRNVQARWMPIQGTSRLTIAVERPGASNDAGLLTDRIELEDVSGRSPLPDLTAEYRWGGSRGYVEAAGLLGRMEWDDLNDDAFDLSGSATRWGVNLSSNVKLGDATTVRLQFVFGEGIQNYMNDAPVDVGIVRGSSVTAPIEGEAIPITASVLFVDHNWSDRWSTSIGYSRTDIDNVEGQADDAYKTGQYALGNLLYSPVRNVMIGGELQWGKREMFRDPYEGDGFKLQFSFRYNFSATFGGQ
jgi:DcaP outer membrane protein